MTPDDKAQAGQRRADLLLAIFFTLLGLAVSYFAFIMPDLAQRRIHPATAPGVVPLMLGIVLTVLGALLTLRAARLMGPGSWADFFAIFRTRASLRVFAALVMILIYTLVMIGRMPFWASSGIFMFAFVLMMEGYLARPRPPMGHVFMWAAITAVGSSAAIYYLFAELFLVRLP